MTAEREVLVPDIGDFKDVDVIEILVKPGDTIQVETPLITIESDKAAMFAYDRGVLEDHGSFLRARQSQTYPRCWWNSSPGKWRLISKAGGSTLRDPHEILAPSTVVMIQDSGLWRYGVGCFARRCISRLL